MGSLLPVLPIDTTLLKPGLRLAVGLSGGADSVALTRALAEQPEGSGWCFMPRICIMDCAARRLTGIWSLPCAGGEVRLPFHEAAWIRRKRWPRRMGNRGDDRGGGAAFALSWFRELFLPKVCSDSVTPKP